VILFGCRRERFTIGFEVDEKYCQIANQRIQNVLRESFTQYKYPMK